MNTGSFIVTRQTSDFDVLLHTPVGEKLLSRTSETSADYLGRINDKYYVTRHNVSGNTILYGDHIVLTYKGYCIIDDDNIIVTDRGGTRRYDTDGRLLKCATVTASRVRHTCFSNKTILHIEADGYTIYDFDGKTLFCDRDKYGDHAADTYVSYTLNDGTLRLCVHGKWQLEKSVNFPIMRCKIIDSQRILIYATLFGTYVASPGSLTELPDIYSSDNVYIVNERIYINCYQHRIVYVHSLDMKQLPIINNFTIQHVCDNLLIGEDHIYDVITETRANRPKDITIEQRVPHDRETINKMAENYKSSLPQFPLPLVKIIISYL